MEATTTRASTVIRSMPTSEMRTQASMTMPLSSTRSSTSIKLVPPGVLSTGMWSFLSSEKGSKLRSASGGGGRAEFYDFNASNFSRGDFGAPDSKGAAGETETHLGRGTFPALARRAFARGARLRVFTRAATRGFDARGRGGQFSYLALERRDALAQFDVLGLGGGGARRQVRVVAPPVQADLLGLVNRADEQTDLERQKLDVRQRDLDVARDDQPLVEDAVEHVNQAGRSRRDEARSLARQFACSPFRAGAASALKRKTLERPPQTVASSQ